MGCGGMARSSRSPRHVLESKMIAPQALCQSGTTFPDKLMRTVSLGRILKGMNLCKRQNSELTYQGFGSFHKPKETHLSSQLADGLSSSCRLSRLKPSSCFEVSRLPWLYVQACCAVLLLCLAHSMPGWPPCGFSTHVCWTMRLVPHDATEVPSPCLGPPAPCGLTNVVIFERQSPKLGFS